MPKPQMQKQPRALLGVTPTAGSAVARVRRVKSLRENIVLLEPDRRAEEIARRWSSLDAATIRERGKFRAEFPRNIGIVLAGAALVTPILGLARIGATAFTLPAGALACAALIAGALLCYGLSQWMLGASQDDSDDASRLAEAEAKMTAETPHG